MGIQLSTVQKTALTKITSSSPVPQNEIIAVIFDPLSQVNWRDADFTLPESQDEIEKFLTHTAETNHIQHLFSYVAKLLDSISSAASSGALTTSGKGAKECANQVLRTTNLARLASVLLFNLIQQCAGNPFVLLRLSNSENEAAMTMLGAAAELVVRVPFNSLTAGLHVETTELIRFSFSTRLFGPGLSLAKDHSMQLSTAFSGHPPASTSSTNANGGDQQESTNNNKNNNDAAVRDPFLRRLALGQRDALLTKALVHSLLQRVIIWSNVLRGKQRVTAWINHQRASNVSTPQDPHPSLTSSKSSATTNNAVSPERNPGNTQNNSNAGLGSKMFGWFFGGGGNDKNSKSSSLNDTSSSLPPSPYANAGVSKTASSAEAIVGSSSLHILLALLFFERGSHHSHNGRSKNNTAVDVIRQLRGLDGTSSTSPSANNNNNNNNNSSTSTSTSLSPILGGEWPQELVDTIATLMPSHFEAVLLLYILLIDCPSFARSITVSSNHGLHVQLAHMTVDIIKTAVERPSSPESLFAAVVIAMIARIDPVARCMFSSERIRKVPEYIVRESPFVTTSMYVGAFLILAITKIIFRASMGDGQAAIGASWLAALVNLSPFVMNLETSVEQKLSSLYLALLRRTIRLKNEVKSNENAFAAAAQLDTAYSHLDILATALFQMVADPQRNPTLLYELLYHKEKLSQLTMNWIEGDAVWRALKPIAFILDRIETELSSSSSSDGGTHRSIPAILEIIKNLGRKMPNQQQQSTSGEKMSVRIQLHARDNNNNNNNDDNDSISDTSSSIMMDPSSSSNAHSHHHHLRFPKITVIGADEEVTLTSYDFEEDVDQDDDNGEADSSSDVEDAANGGSRKGNASKGIIPESFFATILWYYILQTDAKIEAPGCLRYPGSLGFAHGEAFPIFRSA